MSGRDYSKIVNHGDPREPLLGNTEVKEKLSKKTKIFFGFCEFGTFTAGIIQGFFFQTFLLEVAQLKPYWVGIIMLTSQIWDASTDPIIGRLCDVTSTRWGKRRPYLMFGPIFLGILFWLQWQIPGFLTKTESIAYYFVISLLFNSIHTCITIAYSSLTANISTDYDERTSLTTVRFVFGFTGGLIGSFSNAYLITSLKHTETQPDGHTTEVVDYQRGYLLSATIFAVVISIGPILTGILVREKPSLENPKRSKRNALMKFLIGLKNSLTNIPFVLNGLVFLLSFISVNMIQANTYIWVKYVLKAEEHLAYLLLAVQAGSALSMFLLEIISKKFGKIKTLLFGIFILELDLVATYFLKENMIVTVYVIGVLSCIGTSAVILIPWSILPDAVDYEEWKRGKRREGELYSIFLLCQKVALGVSPVISSFALEYSGYRPPSADNPQANDVQPENVIFAIKLLVSFVPAIFQLLACLPIIFYPINKDKHQQIIADLKEKRAQKA